MERQGFGIRELITRLHRTEGPAASRVLHIARSTGVKLDF